MNLPYTRKGAMCLHVYSILTKADFIFYFTDVKTWGLERLRDLARVG
jgi:hypothetical protein